MEKNEFWAIIEEIKDLSGAQQEGKLEVILKEKTILDVVKFSRYFHSFSGDLYGTNLWDILHEHNVSASDDGFEYFTSWVVAKGQAFYEEILHQPQNIKNYVESGNYAPGAEILSYIPYKVGEEKVEAYNEGKLEDKSVRLLGLYEKINYDSLYQKTKISS